MINEVDDSIHKNKQQFHTFKKMFSAKLRSTRHIFFFNNFKSASIKIAIMLFNKTITMLQLQSMIY